MTIKGIYQRFKRAANAFRNYYSGAKTTRLTSSKTSTNASGDTAIRSCLRPLRNRARDFSRNDPLIKRYLRMCVINILGPKGMQFQCEAKMRSGKALDETANAWVETRWTDWGKRKNSPEVTGKLSWAGIQKMILRTVVRDGEILIRLVKNFPNKYRFALQLIEADCLDDLYNGFTADGNEIRMGVELDQWKKPIAYWLLVKHPGDYSFPLKDPRYRVRVPAEEIVHVCDFDRVNDSRAVTWTHSVVIDIDNLAGYEEATLYEARIAATKGPIIIDPENEEPQYDSNGTLITQPIIEELEPGVVSHAPFGSQVVDFNPNSPSGNYPPFVKQKMRRIASGLTVAYESLGNDRESVNFGSLRGGTLEERDNWREHQIWFIESVCEEVQPIWLEVQLELPGTPYGILDFDRLNAGKWSGRSWDWIDPLKDAKATTEGLRAGSLSYTDFYAAQGEDFKEKINQIADERDYMKKKGVAFDLSDRGQATATLAEAEGDPADANATATGGNVMAKKRPRIINGPPPATAEWRPCWKISNKTVDSAEILIYEQIGVSWWDDSGIGAKKFAEDLKALAGVKNITLRINSPGGDVFEGLAIFNQLCMHPAAKDVYIDGLAASIASVIAMCGTVHMPENALLMIHDPATIAMGNADEMRKCADLLDTVKNSLITTYRNKTGLSDNEIWDLMSAETWLNAADAKDKGFCDDCMTPVKMAAQYDLSRFKNAPAALLTVIKNELPTPPAAAITEPGKPEEVTPMKCTVCGGTLDEHGKCTACEKATAAAQAKITARLSEISEISALGKKYRQEDLATQFANEGKSIDDFRKAILDLKPEAKPGPDVKVVDLAATKPFASFGEQLIAVANAAKKPHLVDKRLLSIQDAASGAAASVPSDGGFLIQEDFTIELLNLTHQTGVVAAKCRKVPIGTGKNGLRAPIVDETSRATGSRWGGIQVYRVNDADDLSGKGTKPKFAMLDLKLSKMAGIMYATDELMEDAMALTAIMMQAFPEEFGFVIDDEIINGDGVDKCLGIMSSAAMVQVAKESGQTAGTVVVQNIAKMVARMYARGMANAEWFINQDVLPQLYTMTLGNYPIYMPPGGASTTPYGTLFGRPINVIEQCQTCGTYGDIYFADFTQYLLIEKGGLDAQQSMHVKFLTDEMTFKFTIRNNGQPMWKSSVTPYKGSNTISPFIGLQSR